MCWSQPTKRGKTITVSIPSDLVRKSHDDSFSSLRAGADSRVETNFRVRREEGQIHSGKRYLYCMGF